MNTAYLIFLGLFVLGLVIRTSYERLKKAGRVDNSSRIVFALIFASMFLMWAGWFNMCPLDPLRLTLPGPLPWIGLGVQVLGWGLAIVSVIQLRGLENIDHLVKTGLFSKIRHPMYTGFILWIIGSVMYHGAIVSLAAGLVGIGNILYWQGLEEKALESQFGDDYRAYRTGTWF